MEMVRINDSFAFFILKLRIVVNFVMLMSMHIAYSDLEQKIRFVRD